MRLSQAFSDSWDPTLCRCRTQVRGVVGCGGVARCCPDRLGGGAQEGLTPCPTPKCLYNREPRAGFSTWEGMSQPAPPRPSRGGTKDGTWVEGLLGTFLEGDLRIDTAVGAICLPACTCTLAQNMLLLAPYRQPLPACLWVTRQGPCLLAQVYLQLAATT